jgi:hypothetical protein
MNKKFIKKIGGIWYVFVLMPDYVRYSFAESYRTAVGLYRSTDNPINSLSIKDFTSFYWKIPDYYKFYANNK